jgi:ankyrin repeat protein
VRGDHPIVAKYLIERGFDLNNRDWHGNTCLFEAICRNSHDCIQLFLDSGADYTIVNDCGWKILHATALYGDTRGADILTAARLQNLDPESLDNNSRTPRECLASRPAIPEGFHEAFQKLISSLTRDSYSSQDRGRSMSYSAEKTRHGNSDTGSSTKMLRNLLRAGGTTSLWNVPFSRSQATAALSALYFILLLMGILVTYIFGYPDD